MKSGGISGTTSIMRNIVASVDTFLKHSYTEAPMLTALITALALTNACAQQKLEMQDIVVKAKSLRVYDEVSYAPHSVMIEQPASDVYLGETLSKLPGVLVRNTSGFGSTTT